MRRTLSALILGLCLPTGSVLANKALDYLEAELGVEDWESHGSTEGQAPKEEKEAPVIVDPELPSRWDPELMALLPVQIVEPGPSEFAFRGLYEWRLDNGEIDLSDSPSRDIDSSRSRRARLGFALKTFYRTELQADVLFDGDGDYAGIETLMARVPLGDSLLVSAGKFPPPFTLEYTQDPAVRWRSELSPLVAQVVPASSLGAMIQGQGAQWDWKLGWFSGDADPDLPGWSGDGYLLAGIGYSGFGRPVANGNPRAASWQRWHLDYIYNPDGARSRAVPMGYEHIFAGGFQASSGRFDYMNDFILALGDQSDVWGMTMSGGYWLMEDALRLVARFDYAQSDDAGGVLSGWGVPGSGAEAVQPFSYPVVYAGDQLFSFYSGFDLFLYDRNFILSSGLEFRQLNGLEDEEELKSLIWQTGGRVAF